MSASTHDSATGLEILVSNLNIATSGRGRSRSKEIDEEAVRSWLQTRSVSADKVTHRFAMLKEDLSTSPTLEQAADTEQPDDPYNPDDSEDPDDPDDPEMGMQWEFRMMAKKVARHFKQPFPGRNARYLPLSERISLVQGGDVVNFLLNSWITPQREVEDVQNHPETLQQLYSNFLRTYRGSGVRWLFNALNRYKKQYQSSTHYGKVISFIQSSGAGKTRTLEQLGLELAFVGVCMRGVKERMYNRNAGLDVRNGWPRGDEPVFAFFACGSEYKGEELACAFLAGLFETIADVAERSPKLDDFRKEWEVSGEASTRDTPRYLNFKAAVKRADDLLVKHRKELTELRVIVRKEAQIAEWVGDIYDLLIREQEEKIKQMVAKFNSTLVIGVDECTELNVTTSKELLPNGPSLLALRRAIKACEKLDVWFIFADTSSGLLDTHPATGDLAPSARLRQKLIPFPPYHCLEWDTQFSPKQLPYTPNQALSFSRLKHYGRPYWATVADREVLDVGRRKLLCTDKPFDPEKLQQVLAVFASRALLELGDESSQLAIESVRSHMRIFTGLRPRGVVTTQAPSEPILAAAAATCLLPDQSTYQKATRTLIRELIMEDHVVERGVQGELRARLLLILARDEAEMTACDPWTLDTWATGVRPTKLGDLLRALLDKDLRASQEQSALAADILKWADGYFVNYTHFIQATEDLDELSPDFLHQCWSRGVAIACTHKQPNYDILIVAYGGDLSRPFDATKWAIVSIQVKMRTSAALAAIPARLSCPTVRYPKSGAKKPEHLAILMDLGMQTDFPGSPTGTRCFLHEKQLASNDPETETERYVINVRGCGSDSYGVIKKLAPDIPELDAKQLERRLDCHVDMMRSMAPLTLSMVSERGDIWRSSKEGRAGGIDHQQAVPGVIVHQQAGLGVHQQAGAGGAVHRQAGPEGIIRQPAVAKPGKSKRHRHKKG